MLHLNKKAIIEEPMFFFIGLLMSILMLFAMAGWVDDQLEDTTFEKHYLARDISLLMDSLQAFDNIIYIDYPQETFWFDYTIEENKVTVSEESSFSGESKAEYRFIKDKDISIIGSMLRPEEKPESRESFLKNLLKVKSYFVNDNPEVIDKNKVNLAFLRTGTEIIIDEKENILATNLVFCKKTAPLGDRSSVIQKLENKKAERDFSKPANIFVDFVCTQGDEKLIKFYVPYNSDHFEESNSLACKLANNIAKETEPDGISIIPKQADWLIKNKIHVVIELSNIAIAEQKLGSLIQKTIEEY